MAEAKTNWDDPSRIKASQRWRKQSAIMGQHFTSAIVAEAQVAAGMIVLDVASGSGEPAISIATLLKGSGRVVATDVSLEPLKLAEQRAQQHGLMNIEFQRADVHELPFADATFDRVTCRLGVMFFSDVTRALREIRRVLKPGGRASFLAWGPMQQPYFDTTIGTILRTLPGTTPPSSGLAMFAFAEPGTLTAELRHAGFAHVAERLETLPWNWAGTPEEVWEYFQEVTVPFKPLFDAIPAGQRELVWGNIVNAISRYSCDGEIRFTATAVLASAIA
jgi:ubiquinone/menaquinone biosynthesis C-methylase UbiE